MLRIKYILFFLLLINIGLIMGLKLTSFPFVSMHYASNEDNFNSFNIDYNIPIDARLRQKILQHFNKQDFMGDLENQNYAAVIRSLSAYVRSRLKHESGYPEDIASFIMDAQEVSAICSGYAKLFSLAAQALNLKSRVIWMHGHTANEVYFPNYGWVYVDSNGNIFYLDKQGHLASAIDIINNLDKVQPQYIIHEDDGDPNYIQSDLDIVWETRQLLFIEGPHLLDFHSRSLSFDHIWNYLFYNQPIAKGVQYLAPEHPRLGNFRNIVLGVMLINLVGVLLFVMKKFYPGIKEP